MLTTKPKSECHITGHIIKPRVLLICGIFASLLYVGTDISAGLLWQGYNFTQQAISELSGLGAPTRPLVVPLYSIYSVLMIAFGMGVLIYSQKRALWLIGTLMVGIGVVGFVQMLFPLQLGGVDSASTNMVHSILAGVSGILFLLSMGLGIFISGKRFRVYSVGTLLALIVIGAISGLMAGSQISVQGFTEPPRWFGLIERIDVYGSILWVLVLAIVLLQRESMQVSLAKQVHSG
jgi:hypothetical protein